VWITYVKVLIPQALTRAILPFGNLMVDLLKGTALLSAISSGCFSRRSSSSSAHCSPTLEAVTSADAAVRGHRLFGVGDLDEVVLHPPIQRFLARWQPGDPTVYLGPLWAP